jgi:hypothetical protein
MSALHSCPQCQGFNPSHLSVCLHCDHRVSTSPKRLPLVNMLTGAGAVVAMSMTLSACYGGPMDFTPLTSVPVDQDQDGVLACEDCDDNDPDVTFPDYEKTCRETYGEALSESAPTEEERAQLACYIDPEATYSQPQDQGIEQAGTSSGEQAL